jgi:AbrB family looped-hinge helix DNA binding protein
VKCDVSLAENFCGVATVGDRGQIVIPSEARKKANIHPGDKIAVIRHPVTDGLIICKIEGLREFLAFLADEMDQIESKMNQAQDAASDE